jgi:hypothetical protein
LREVCVVANVVTRKSSEESSGAGTFFEGSRASGHLPR